MNIEEAIEFMKERHEGQKRKQGTPYYTHPLAVREMLKEKGFSETYQIVGLFHDLIEDTDTTYEEILEMTNLEIAEAVKLVTKENGYVMKEYMERIKKNHMARMVKLADRIHNLSELSVTSKEFQKRYIKETQEWFLDMAKGTVFEDDLNKVLEEDIKSLEDIGNS